MKWQFKEGLSYRSLFPKTTHQNVSCQATGVLGGAPKPSNTLGYRGS